VRSANRDVPKLPHHPYVLALQQQIEAGTETNLYLTRRAAQPGRALGAGGP
jgi:hypothetical protein